MGGDPHAAPESLELQLLREIQREMRRRFDAIERRLGKAEAAQGLIINEQRRLGLSLGLAPITPLPRAVGDSWAPPPDHGDQGVER